MCHEKDDEGGWFGVFLAVISIISVSFFPSPPNHLGNFELDISVRGT